MKKSLIPLLLVLFQLSACTPQINGLVHETSFNRATIKSGGITVGGIAAAPKAINEKNKHVYTGLLKDELAAGLQGIRVDSNNKIIDKISALEFSAILAEFYDKGAMSAAQMNKLKDSVSTRYLVLARVDKNDVSNDRVISLSSTTTYAYRDTGVSLYVFDMQSGQRVWGGSLASSRSTSQKYSYDVAALNILRGISALNSGNLDSAYPYPDPYSEREMLSYLFWGFGKNLGGLK